MAWVSCWGGGRSAVPAGLGSALGAEAAQAAGGAGLWLHDVGDFWSSPELSEASSGVSECTDADLERGCACCCRLRWRRSC